MSVLPCAVIGFGCIVHFDESSCVVKVVTPAALHNDSVLLSWVYSTVFSSIFSFTLYSYLLLMCVIGRVSPRMAMMAFALAIIANVQLAQGYLLTETAYAAISADINATNLDGSYVPCDSKNDALCPVRIFTITDSSSAHDETFVINRNRAPCVSYRVSKAANVSFAQTRIASTWPIFTASLNPLAHLQAALAAPSLFHGTRLGVCTMCTLSCRPGVMLRRV